MANLNILKNVATVAAVSTVAVMASTGKASAITINFNGTPTTVFQPPGPTTLTGTQGGIQFTAEATANTSESVFLVRNNLGLGILSGDNGDDNNQVDGLDIGESLRLTFNPQVKLLRAIFSAVDNNGTDDYIVSIPSSAFSQSGNISGQGNLITQGIYSVLISGSPFAPTYVFSVTGADDDYFLKAVEVQPVPEPLTMGGIALGATFGAYLRKRYSKKDEKLVKA
ncbi:hypothetical protein NIES2109_01500 [Nostoc sp. HK-01]|nr:hypothetical protein NIES2109_01500 [Nostoc sp. HK-01]